MANSLLVQDALSIIGKYPKNEIFLSFIETGTNHGSTIFGIENIFDRLYTIELKKEFCEGCKKQYKGNKIKFYQGDSSKVLPSILEHIKDNVVFYLDAHWSALNTAHGDKENPLLEEIETINKFKNYSIVIIDDHRLFGVNIKDCNWSDITEENILSRIDKNRIIRTFVEYDRYVIYLNKI